MRAIARALGLPVADKPSLACLCSRVALGLPITPVLLARIDAAERAVRAMGVDVVGVRPVERLATIEVSAEEVDGLGAHPGRVRSPRPADHEACTVLANIRA